MNRCQPTRDAGAIFASPLGMILPVRGRRRSSVRYAEAARHVKPRFDLVMKAHWTIFRCALAEFCEGRNDYGEFPCGSLNGCARQVATFQFDNGALAFASNCVSQERIVNARGSG